MANLMGNFPNNFHEQVTLANWRTEPFNKWAFHHVAEIIPSAEIQNNPTNIQKLDKNTPNLTEIKLEAVGNKRIELDTFLDKTFTDALVIMKCGKIIEERYNNGMTKDSLHILMSVSKSLLGLLIGILIDQKILNTDQLVTDIIPELENTAYKGASVRQLLDMRTGVSFDEDYLATNGKIIDYRKATNWNPLSKDDHESNLRSFYKLLKNSDGPHGGNFHYVSPNTDLLGWLIERASGSRYSDLMSELLWKPIGATRPANITVDRLGAPRVAGGMCTTARDLAIVGQLILENGTYNNKQIIPSSWIEDIKNNGSEKAWEGGNFATYFPTINMHYRSKWYVENKDNNKKTKMLFAVGVHGQNLFIDIEKKLVIVKFSSQPLPLDKNLIELTTRWVTTLRNIL